MSSNAAVESNFLGEGAPIVLIVDDEESIRRSLEGVLLDEGYSTLVAEDGASAMTLLQTVRPALILLDIWMAGIDGIETLKMIKELYPDLPVIMISGHATIATAIAATRLGASDFIEKPLDLEVTIRAVKKALGGQTEIELDQRENLGLVPTSDLTVSRSESVQIEPLAFNQQGLAGQRFVQKTLGRSVVLYGQGLHSGRKSGLILEPLPSGSGIHFVGVSGTKAVPAHVDFVESTGYATTVRVGHTQAGTIEHLMSALHAYGISNLLIKCNGEVPVMDGSALEFCSLIEDAGVEEQTGDWFEIEIKEKISFGDERKLITIEPADEFIIDYTLEYPAPVGRQQLVFRLGDIATYKREIAPARTFGFVRDIGALQKQGLALGGRFDNFVLLGESGVINGELRFSDEPVRHKILDAIGDLYLLGRRIRGKVTARMTGHSDNIGVLKVLRDKLR